MKVNPSFLLASLALPSALCHLRGRQGRGIRRLHSFGRGGMMKRSLTYDPDWMDVDEDSLEDGSSFFEVAVASTQEGKGGVAPGEGGKGGVAPGGDVGKGGTTAGGSIAAGGSSSSKGGNVAGSSIAAGGSRSSKSGNVAGGSIAAGGSRSSKSGNVAGGSIAASGDSKSSKGGSGPSPGAVAPKPSPQPVGNTLPNPSAPINPGVGAPPTLDPTCDKPDIPALPVPTNPPTESPTKVPTPSPVESGSSAPPTPDPTCDTQDHTPTVVPGQTDPTNLPTDTPSSAPTPLCGNAVWDESQGEDCDFTADPSGCDDKSFCNLQCVCEPLCGNGVVDSGETCEPSAGKKCDDGDDCVNCACIPSPTASPTKAPTPRPTAPPTASPTKNPTPQPTKAPTTAPTKAPTPQPTVSPTLSPVESGSGAPPTPDPTCEQHEPPTVVPGQPDPTNLPSAAPTPMCGNDVYDEGLEECDLSSNVENHGCELLFECVEGCMCEPKCGNGEVDDDVNEECDYMASKPGCKKNYYCDMECGCQPYCGNGQLDEDKGEECDYMMGDAGCNCGTDCKCITESPTIAPVDSGSTVPPTQHTDCPSPKPVSGSLPAPPTPNPTPKAKPTPSPVSASLPVPPTPNPTPKAKPSPQPVEPTSRPVDATPSPVVATIPDPTSPPTVGPYCGDGEVDDGEECDWNASGEPNYGCEDDDEYCSTICVCLPRCGNGDVDGDEECDVTDTTEPNHGCDSGYSCNTDCECLADPTPSPTPPPVEPTSSPVIATIPDPTSPPTVGPYCGDGEVDDGEECDWNASGEPNYGCDDDDEYCSTICTCLPRCGNGDVDGDEECDVTDTTEPNHGCDSGHTCNTNCECLADPTPSPTPPPVEPTSSPVIATIPDPTNPPTVGPYCGDGEVDEGEECDFMSNEPNYGCDDDDDYCSTICSCLPKCGNGDVDGDEECDPTDADEPNHGCDSGHTCNTNCECIADPTPSPTNSPTIGPFCGDGEVNGDEACDYMSNEPNRGCDDGAVCDNLCQCVVDPTPAPVIATIPDPTNSPTPPCGNFEMDDGEQCDPTAANNPGCPEGSYCESCMCVPYCGNGVMDEGEECDPSAANNPGCSSGLSCEDCKCVGCGDGIVGPDEECDPLAINPGCDVNESCNDECLCEGIDEIPGVDICINYTLDFNTKADGTAVIPGEYVEDSWWGSMGITMEVVGGADSRPRVFDTANPGPDPDLGAPNESCEGGGPGVGLGGEVGTPGENCEPLGNVLIIQEQNDDITIPDDEARGGTITMNFDPALLWVYELGMMDIERRHPPTTLYVTHNGESGVEQLVSFPIDGTGNNGVQTIPVNLNNVTKLSVEFGTSGAIDWLTVCY